jgi:hypothetical protein
MITLMQKLSRSNSLGCAQDVEELIRTSLQAEPPPCDSDPLAQAGQLSIVVLLDAHCYNYYDLLH